MSLNEELTLVRYTFDGVTATYLFDFTSPSTSIIKVLYGEGEFVGKDTALIEGTNYTISINASGKGGTVTLIIPSLPTLDFEVLTIQRVVLYEQPTSFGRFSDPLESETSDDNVVLQTQQLKDLYNNIDGFLGEVEIAIEPPNEVGRIPEIEEAGKAKFKGSPLLNTGTNVTSSLPLNVPDLTTSTLTVNVSASTAQLLVTGSAGINGNLLVNGSSDFVGFLEAVNVGILEDLTVVGKSILDNVEITNELSVGDNVEITNELSVGGNVEITNELSVGGAVEFADNLAVTGDITSANIGATTSCTAPLAEFLRVNVTERIQLNFVEFTATGTGYEVNFDLGSAVDGQRVGLTVTGNTVSLIPQDITGVLPDIEVGDLGKQLEVTNIIGSVTGWVAREHVPDISTGTDEDVVIQTGGGISWGRPAWAVPIPTVSDARNIIQVSVTGVYELVPLPEAGLPPTVGKNIGDGLLITDPATEGYDWSIPRPDLPVPIDVTDDGKFPRAIGGVYELVTVTPPSELPPYDISNAGQVAKVTVTGDGLEWLPESGSSLPPTAGKNIGDGLLITDPATEGYDWGALRPDLPLPSTGTNNQIPVVQGNVFVLTDIPAGNLPPIVAGDARKSILVNQAETAYELDFVRKEIPIPVDGDDDNKILKANAGVYNLEEDIPELPPSIGADVDDVATVVDSATGAKEWKPAREDLAKASTGVVGDVMTIVNVGGENRGEFRTPSVPEASEPEYLVGDMIATFNEKKFDIEGSEYVTKGTRQKVIPMRGQIIDLLRYPDLLVALDLRDGVTVEIKSEVPSDVIDIKYGGNVGYAVTGGGVYYVTEDAGVEFRTAQFSIGAYTTCGLSSNADFIYMAGQLGLVRFKTSVGGAWNRAFLPNSPNITCSASNSDASRIIFGADNGRVYVVEDKDFADATEINTTEGVTQSEVIGLTDISLAEDLSLAVVTGTNGFIAESTDFVNWRIVSAIAFNPQGRVISSGYLKYINERVLANTDLTDLIRYKNLTNNNGLFVYPELVGSDEVNIVKYDFDGDPVSTEVRTGIENPELSATGADSNRYYYAEKVTGEDEMEISYGIGRGDIQGALGIVAGTEIKEVRPQAQGVNVLTKDTCTVFLL